MITLKRWIAVSIAVTALSIAFVVFKIVNKPNRPFTVLSTTGMLNCLKFSPDGNILVAGDHRGFPRLKWWRWKSRELLHEVTTKHDAAITDIAFSANGQQFITRGFYDVWLRTWNVDSGVQIAEKRVPYSSLKAIRPPKWAISHDSELVASAQAGTVSVRHSKNQQPTINIRTYETQFFTFAFSPDKRWLAGSAHRDSFKGTRIYIWEVSALKP